MKNQRNKFTGEHPPFLRFVGCLIFPNSLGDGCIALFICFKLSAAVDYFQGYFTNARPLCKSGARYTVSWNSLAGRAGGIHRCTVPARRNFAHSAPKMAHYSPKLSRHGFSFET